MSKTHSNGSGDNPGDPDCALGAANKARIDGLDQRYDEFLDWMRRVEDKIEAALHAALKRPGWGVVVIISFLSSLCVGLIIALASKWADVG